VKISPSSLSEIEVALKAYINTVLATDLSAASQGIYTDHASNFVRWMKGEFNPGARANPYPLKRKKDPVVNAFNPEGSEK
jgi:hypothetical protein